MNSQVMTLVPNTLGVAFRIGESGDEHPQHRIGARCGPYDFSIGVWESRADPAAGIVRNYSASPL
jgi:hypothetical protein